MIYYILLILLILLLRIQVKQRPCSLSRISAENKACKLVWLIIILLAALRNTKVGTDTLGYLLDYQELPNYTFESLAYRYKGYLGYYYASKIFSLLGFSVKVWFGFIEALYALALYMLTDKFSKDKLFSILLFVTIGLLTFSMAGLKQVMAMSFMIFAFLSFLNKRYIQTVLYIFIAYFCHIVVLVFLAVFVLYIIRNKKYFFPLVFLVTFLCYFYGSGFFVYVIDFLDNSHFESYLEIDTSYTAVTLIFYCIILLVSLFGYKYYYGNESSLARFVLGVTILVCAVQSLASISPNMFRLALCYAPFMMFILPNTIYYSRNKQLELIIIVFVILYFLYVNRNTPYSFYWQKL